jgi:OOP family OmpA-OmpF porin
VSVRSRATGLLVGALVLAAGGPVAAGQEQGELPVAGTFAYHVQQDERQPEIRGVVHAVRRIPGGTAVYYSLGVPAGERWTPNAVMPVSKLFEDYAFGDAAAVGLVDAEGLRYYQPMVGEQGCLCPRVGDLDGEAGVLHTGWAVVPPLPADVAQVDVVLGFGVQVADAPVGDGPLEPSVSQPSTVVGEGWPALPDDAVVESVPDPARYVRALVRNVADLEQVVTTAERADRVDESLAADVLFAVDSAELTPAAQTTVAAVAGRIAERAVGPGSVTGHTDDTGAADHNQRLSAARGQAVLDALRAELGPDVQITATGRGETEPVADNGTAEGRARNRRVTISYAVSGS